MKKTAGITAIISGLLLIIVPHYVLPACEFEGFARMHCSDTAQAELFTGILLIAAGVCTLVFSGGMRIAAVSGSLLFSLAALVIPEQFGYCRSPKMPCNYGMVPAVRLIAAASALMLVIALLSIVNEYRKKGKA